jgi:hypothetical protein
VPARGRGRGRGCGHDIPARGASAGRGHGPILPLPPVPPGAISPNARLQPNIRTLAELWQEYELGIGSNKPAKNFTSYES